MKHPMGNFTAARREPAACNRGRLLPVHVHGGKRDLSYFKRMTVPQVVVGKWMADVYFDGYYLVIEN